LNVEDLAMPVTREQFESSLKRVASRLVKLIPERVASLGLTDPAYCVFLLYEDGTSDDMTPTLMVGTKPLLDACNDGLRDGIGDLANQGKAWYPQQCISAPFPGFPCPGERLTEVAEDTRICYRYEIIEPEDIRDDPAYYREMLTKVARQLNKLNWREIVPVTEQFFVVATDYTACNLFEDLPKCVSPARFQKLREAYRSLADIEPA
jgi:hypothetical protein